MKQVLLSANRVGKFYIDLSLDDCGVYILTFFRWGLPTQHHEFISECGAIEQYKKVLNMLKD